MKIGHASWLGSTGLKAFVVANSLNLFREDEGAAWYVFSINGDVIHETRIFKDGGSDQADFESSFSSLSLSNPASSIIQPFASKTLQNGKKLYARTTGFQAALTAGANVITYTAIYPWAKVIGIEVINCEALDTANLKVIDTATGTYSTIPNYQLNQFAFSVNFPKDFYQRISPFDADLYVGMIIKIEYTSVSAKTVGFNLIMSEVK
jgi:hypothetical protein